MTRATGIGSHPGSDQRAYDDAVAIVLGELDLPYVPEVPGRGAIADMTGRTLALLPLGADLQPAGWRLGSTGVDQRRALSLLKQDLDTLEEQSQGFEGVIKTQVAGPWTLAATTERPRGDKVLGDFGARRDLVQALAHGVSEHLADLRRRVPGARWIIQLDEPAGPAVLNAEVPTASGFHRHRAVQPPEFAEALEEVIAAAGEDVWVHCCAAGMPWNLVSCGISADLALLGPADHDRLAAALDEGRTVALGVVPATGGDPTQVSERVLRWLDLIGLEPSDQLVLTPACGLAGSTPTQARAALATVREAARHLTTG